MTTATLSKEEEEEEEVKEDEDKTIMKVVNENDIKKRFTAAEKNDYLLYFSIDKSKRDWKLELSNVLSTQVQTLVKSNLEDRTKINHGWGDANSFQWHEPPSSLMARFITAIENCFQTNNIVNVGIAFHGTNYNNHKSILQEGLAEDRRNGQTHGDGEYFSTQISEAVSYTKSISTVVQKVLVFLIIDPYSCNNNKYITSYNPTPRKMVVKVPRPFNLGGRNKKPHHVIVVPNNTHHLPIGILKCTRTRHVELLFLKTCITNIEIHLLHQQTLYKILNALKVGKINKASKIYRISTKSGEIWGSTSSATTKTTNKTKAGYGSDGHGGQPPKLSMNIQRQLSYHVHNILMEGIVSIPYNLIEYYFPNLPPRPTGILPITCKWDINGLEIDVTSSTPSSLLAPTLVAAKTNATATMKSNDTITASTSSYINDALLASLWIKIMLEVNLQSMQKDYKKAMRPISGYRNGGVCDETKTLVCHNKRWNKENMNALLVAVNN